jgi:hypothetical protein
MYLNFDPSTGFIKMEDCELEDIRATLRESQRPRGRRRYAKEEKAPETDQEEVVEL